MAVAAYAHTQAQAIEAAKDKFVETTPTHPTWLVELLGEQSLSHVRKGETRRVETT